MAGPRYDPALIMEILCTYFRDNPPPYYHRDVEWRQFLEVDFPAQAAQAESLNPMCSCWGDACFLMYARQLSANQHAIPCAQEENCLPWRPV